MIQELNFKGKVAVVTGAKQGIGRCIAGRLAECGADVAVMDINLTDEDAVCKEVVGFGSKCFAFSGDVSDEAAMAKMFTEIKAKFGRCDILVNNAGITRDSMAKKMTMENFRKVIDVNLIGTFICAQKAMEIMRDVGDGGAIVNFSSISAFRGNIGQVNYCASKFGVVGVTRCLAMEGAKDKIRVNAIAPGFIETPMTETIPEKIKNATISLIPLQRIGYPIDMANTVLYLCSELSSYMTGQTLHVNGGRYI